MRRRQPRANEYITVLWAGQIEAGGCCGGGGRRQPITQHGAKAGGGGARWPPRQDPWWIKEHTTLGGYGEAGVQGTPQAQKEKMLSLKKEGSATAEG